MLVQIEEENKTLETELQENVNATTQANDQALQSLEHFEEVRLFYDFLTRYTDATREGIQKMARATVR